MSTSTVAPPPSVVSANLSHDAAHRSSTMLVFCCTLIGAAAQMFIKIGATHENPHTFMEAVVATIKNLPLLFGYSLYAINTVLMVLALKKGELSLIYPIIALTYVWVTILSVAMFHESLNPFKVGGLALIVFGVSVLGKRSRA